MKQDVTPVGWSKSFRPAGGFVVCLAAGVLALGACVPSYPHNPELDAELTQRSLTEGLGIITTSPTTGTFPLMYFNQKWEQVACCGRSRPSWVTPGGKKLISEDFSGIWSNPTGAQSWGSNVILFDLKGVVQRRLNCWIHAPFLAVSPDEKMIAFKGQGGSPPSSGGPIQSGLLFGSLSGTMFHKIYSFSEGSVPATERGKRAETLAWSPDGGELTYGKDGILYVYNLRQNDSRALAKGSNPLWSPDGGLISYRGPNGEGMLVDPSGKTSQQILRGQTIDYALHWSPDGRYLLLTLLKTQGGLQWANLMIYRMSDGAVTAIGKPGLRNVGDAYDEWIVTGPPH